MTCKTLILKVRHVGSGHLHFCLTSVSRFVTPVKVRPTALLTRSTVSVRTCPISSLARVWRRTIYLAEITTRMHETLSFSAFEESRIGRPAACPVPAAYPVREGLSRQPGLSPGRGSYRS